MEIKRINYDFPEYREALDLRDRVLRKPLGMSIFNDDLTGESNDIHLGAFENGNLLGCLILSRIDADHLKMRQVAVELNQQGKGIGAAMVAFAERYAVENRCQKITLHARKVVVAFYQRLGYQILGDEFTEVGIPHLKMEKVF